MAQGGYPVSCGFTLEVVRVEHRRIGRQLSATYELRSPAVMDQTGEARGLTLFTCTERDGEPRQLGIFRVGDLLMVDLKKVGTVNDGDRNRPLFFEYVLGEREP